MGAQVLSMPVQFETHTCGKCGITFAAPETFWSQKVRDKTPWYCPNGCCRVFTGPTEDQKRIKQLERQLASSRESADYARDRADRAERSASAYKGQVTKIKNRVGKGVCPCCNRTFANLARHMQSQHPDFSHEEAEASCK